jgi:REP element-mobilizing transposase RayT
MPAQLYVHIVWTTRDRDPSIDAPIARFLRRYLRAIAAQERAAILEIGIVRTHVHVLAALHQTTQIPRLVQRFKGGSAVIAAREGVTLPGHLKWAKGYSITTVSERSLDSVRQYVRDQPRRHPSLVIKDFDAEQPGPETETSL